jgi:DNA polymerase-3 subunit delta
VPALDTDGFRRQLQSGKVARVYLLYGDDVRLVEQLVDALEATVDEADRPFAVERVYAGESGGSPVDIVAAASVLPMLGDRRIVTVLRSERFLKPARKGTASDDGGDGPEADDAPGAVDTSALEAYLDNPSPSGVLVFVASGIDRGRRLTKRLLEKAHTVECAGVPDLAQKGGDDARRQIVAKMQREIQMAGRTIDTATAQLLLDRAGGEISKLRDDVDRLLLYTDGRQKITRADVEEVVSAHAEINEWAVVNALGDGDSAAALREVALRFDRGDSPHALLGQIRWWVSQQLARSAPARVKPALEALLRTDLALKSSGGEERVLVERLVVELAGRPGTRPSYGAGRR